MRKIKKNHAFLGNCHHTRRLFWLQFSTLFTTFSCKSLAADPGRDHFGDQYWVITPHLNHPVYLFILFFPCVPEFPRILFRLLIRSQLCRNTGFAVVVNSRCTIHTGLYRQVDSCLFYKVQVGIVRCAQTKFTFYISNQRVVFDLTRSFRPVLILLF